MERAIVFVWFFCDRKVEMVMSVSIFNVLRIGCVWHKLRRRRHLSVKWIFIVLSNKKEFTPLLRFDRYTLFPLTMAEASAHNCYRVLFISNDSLAWHWIGKNVTKNWKGACASVCVRERRRKASSPMWIINNRVENSFNKLFTWKLRLNKPTNDQSERYIVCAIKNVFLFSEENQTKIRLVFRFKWKE